MMTHAIAAEGIRLKRVYEPASPEDGMRILVDRLWPRGLRKEDAAVDRWLKEIAPSTALRQWFGHDPVHWPEFRRRYTAELRQHAATLDEIRELAKQETITLVFGARDEQHNDAVVLRKVLLKGSKAQ
jgi:uncharacterized protein YeaO (DUF488 family)